MEKISRAPTKELPHKDVSHLFKQCTSYQRKGKKILKDSGMFLIFNYALVAALWGIVIFSWGLAIIGFDPSILPLYYYLHFGLSGIVFFFIIINFFIIQSILKKSKKNTLEWGKVLDKIPHGRT